MNHQALFVYARADGGRTLHWMRGCPLRFGADPGRLREFRRHHPLIADLAHEGPHAVITRLVDELAAAVCVHCVPDTILLELGVDPVPGARAGTVLGG